MTCDRCAQTCSSTICSMFNTEQICEACKTAERADPRYAEAVAADEAAIRRGDYNFPGIGLLDDDENVKAMRETAQAIGLTQLLADTLTALDRQRACVAEALQLLGAKKNLGIESSCISGKDVGLTPRRDA